MVTAVVGLGKMAHGPGYSNRRSEYVFLSIDGMCESTLPGCLVALIMSNEENMTKLQHYIHRSCRLSQEDLLLVVVRHASCPVQRPGLTLHPLITLYFPQGVAQVTVTNGW